MLTSGTLTCWLWSSCGATTRDLLMQSRRFPFIIWVSTLSTPTAFSFLALEERTPYDGVLSSIELTLCRRIIELTRAETPAEAMLCPMSRQRLFVSQGPMLAHGLMTFCHNRSFVFFRATRLFHQHGISFENSHSACRPPLPLLMCTAMAHWAAGQFLSDPDA